MSEYKVPQDVEAEDKLLGPFSFRQFVYLFVAVGLCALEWLFISTGGVMLIFTIFPLPIIILFGALALPLKKDQPMETYLAAIVSFYLKPKIRLWKADGREHLITITAPKKAEVNRVRDISEEEADKRLTFLANVVDSEGQVIKNSNVNEELNREASTVPDMFDDSPVGAIFEKAITTEQVDHHTEILEHMRQIINEQEKEIEESYGQPTSAKASVPPAKTDVVVDPYQPLVTVDPEPVAEEEAAPIDDEPETADATSEIPANPDIINELASTSDLSVETLSKIAKQKEDEVFVAIKHNT